MGMSTATKELLTVGVIADRLGVKVHNVQRIVRTLNIAPVGRAGMSFVFSDAAMKKISDEVQRIAARRALLAGAPVAAV
jgi:hypothetical protein